MAPLKNEDLEEVLRPQLGNDCIVESFTSTSLTQPGDNYGSTMLALDVTIIHGNKIKQNLPLVAKLPPPSDFLWTMFDVPNTFCKEINCYTKVKEEYEKLQKEKNIPLDKFLDIFPKYFGARTTKSATEIGTVADRDAILLLENLKASNYRLGNRLEGLDLVHSELVITQLARFHAVSVAIKLLKPHVFEQTILKSCKPLVLGLTKEEMEESNLKLIQQIKTIPECEMYAEKLKKFLWDNMEEILQQLPDVPNEPFGAICHIDFWVNNMMFCYDTNNKPTKVKFIDFQIVKYSSPVRDLIFFLYSSTADGVVEDHFESLVQLYYDTFIGFLSDLGCDITPFTFQDFLHEIDVIAPLEGAHIFFMLRGISANEKDVPALAEVDDKTILSAPNELFNKRVKNFVLNYAKRGWL